MKISGIACPNCEELLQDREVGNIVEHPVVELDGKKVKHYRLDYSTHIHCSGCGKILDLQISGDSIIVSFAY